jgi:hypothetical protein
MKSATLFDVVLQHIEKRMFSQREGYEGRMKERSAIKMFGTPRFHIVFTINEGNEGKRVFSPRSIEPTQEFCALSLDFIGYCKMTFLLHNKLFYYNRTTKQ